MPKFAPHLSALTRQDDVDEYGDTKGSSKLNSFYLEPRNREQGKVMRLVEGGRVVDDKSAWAEQALSSCWDPYVAGAEASQIFYLVGGHP